MALADSDVKLKKSNAHPSDDTTAAGGTKSATVITNGAVGEWFTRLRAKLTGTIDDSGDIAQEYQKVFVDNTSSADDLLDGLIYVHNGMIVPPTTGVISFQSTNAGDDSTVKVIAYGEDASNLLNVDSAPLNGVSLVTGAGSVSFIRAFRCKLCAVSNDALVAALGDISIFIDGTLVGIIPAGYSFATAEVKLWVVATTDDSGTSTNRKTAPSGSTFVAAMSLATALSIRNDSGNDTLAHGVAQGLWGELTLQPGMPAFNGVEVVIGVAGDGT